ncbi:AAA family ATPase [Terrisporobacter sp.]|uniref:AAA family ATPase n=1 Tax=Terrisporobacter sp. TaxID=1965305 RepID=UPI003994B894
MNKTKIKIDRIMFPKNTKKTNPGDYCIFTAKVEQHIEGDKPILHETYKTMTLKGVVPSIKAGDVYIAHYNNPETNNYGTSYSLVMITTEIDRTDKKQVQDYLKMLCGDQIAKELIKLNDPIGMIERRETENLLKIKGIGKKKLDSIYDNIEQTTDYSGALAALEPLGLTKQLIINICTAYGSPETAIQICKTKPYDLVKKVKGISFSKADEIARKCALNMTSDSRLECLIYVILNENGQGGRSYLHANQLIALISDVMRVDMEQLNRVVAKMYADKTIILTTKGQHIGLTQYFELEKQICEELMRLVDAKTRIKTPGNWRETVKKLEERQKWTHTDEQLLGIETTLKNNVVIVTGKAGTGKSTITNAMLEILDDYDAKLTCLSAKASQRIEEVTGRSASTIHRLLKIGVPGLGGAMKPEPILTDILIVDESSMVNGELFLKLLKNTPDGTKVIILGDDGQLQAIGDCAVLSDLLTTSKIPIIRLNKIHRQAQKSAIVTKSIAIRNQEEIYPRGYEGHMTLGELQDLELFIQKEKEGLIQHVINSFKKELEKNNGNVLEVQVITPMKKRGNLCTYKLNKELQKIYNSCTSEYYEDENVRIYVGDKVINTKNNYKIKNTEGEITPIFNGNIGIVKDITENTIVVDFNGEDIVFKGSVRQSLNLAYAITTHSSQGSQWESVIVAIDSGAWLLLTVEMLYTAITRASKHCVLIAEDKAVAHAIKTVEQKTKQTYLSKFLEFYKKRN